MIPELRRKVIYGFARKWGWDVFPTRPNSKHEFAKGHIYDRSHATNLLKWVNTLTNSKDPQLQDCNCKGIVAEGYCVVDVEPSPEERGDIYDWLLAQGVISMESPCNPTADGGYHFFMELPDGVNLEGSERYFWLTDGDWLPKGLVEIRMPGSEVMLPESVVKGVTYTFLNLTKFMAVVSEYLTAEIEKRNTEHRAKLAKRSEQMAITGPRSVGTVTNAAKAYAEAALVNNIKRLRETEKGQRWAKLCAVSTLGGSFAHILEPEYICKSIFDGINEDDWGTPTKNLKTIQRCMQIGAKNPKTPPPPNGKRFENQSRSALAAIDSELDGVKWGGKFTGTKGNVMALSVHDALKTIVKRGSEVGSLDVVASVRWLAETAQMSTSTSWKVLQVAQEMDLLRVSREGTPASGEANIYHLTAAGFNALRQMRQAETAKTWTKTIQVLVKDDEKSSLIQRNTFNKDEEEEVSLSLTSTCIDFVFLGNFQNAEKDGIFTRAGIGRSGRLILEYLATQPMTLEQLQATTGLCKKTVERVLGTLEHFGFIATSGDLQTLNPLGFGEAVSKVQSVGRTKAVKRLRKIKIGLARNGYRKARQEAADAHAERDKELNRKAAAYDAEDSARFYDADGVKVDDPYGANEPFGFEVTA